MRFTKIVGLTGLALTLGMGSAYAADGATPEEVVAKVRAAAEAIAKDSTAALAEMNKKDGEWVWKDSYIFAYDCKADKMAAHPMKASLVGGPVLQIKDKAGKELFKELCSAGEQEKGGWVTYMWPKPGSDAPVQKISYAVQVNGSTVQVGAGVYGDNKLEDLNKLLK